MELVRVEPVWNAEEESDVPPRLQILPSNSQQKQAE